MTEKEEQNNSDQALQLRARIDAKDTEFTRIIKKLVYFNRNSDEILESADRD